MTAYVVVTRVVRDEGSIVVLEGIAEDGGRVEFAADHRPAHAIAASLDAGARPLAEVEPWQVLRHERTLAEFRATNGGDYYAEGPRVGDSDR